MRDSLIVPSRRRRMTANVRAERLLKIPAEPSPELRIPGAAAQTRVVSMAGIRLGSWESARARLVSPAQASLPRSRDRARDQFEPAKWQSHRIVSDDTKREMAGLSARACASRQAHRLVVESKRFPQDCEFQSNPSFHPACPFTSSRGEVPLSRTAHRHAVVPTAVRRWVTLRRGFAQWILVPLVALFWPWCPLQIAASCQPSCLPQ